MPTSGSEARRDPYMPADEYASWRETAHLLRSPSNARRLMEAVARDKAGTPAADTNTEGRKPSLP